MGYDSVRSIMIVIGKRVSQQAIHLLYTQVEYNSDDEALHKSEYEIYCDKNRAEV